MDFGQSQGMNQNIVLQDTLLPVGYRTTFDFTNTDPFSFNHSGARAQAELNTVKQSRNKVNIASLNYSGIKNRFEFNDISNQYFASCGHNSSVNLDTAKTILSRYINFPNVGYYEPPVKPNFELGADSIEIIRGAGGEVNPTDYDLSFQQTNVINQTAYDLIFLPAQDRVNKSFSWDFYAVFNGSHLDVSLFTERDVKNNKLLICGSPTGNTVLSEISFNDNVNNDFIFNKTLLDNTFEFKFNDTLGDCSYEIQLNPIESGYKTDASLSISGIGLDTEQIKTTDFDLYECIKTSDFNLTPCSDGVIVNGKNLNYDILLCPADANPPLNIENHSFNFDASYLDKNCDEFIIDFYHGSEGIFLLAKDIIFGSVEAYYGQFSDANLQTTQTFTTNAYHGALNTIADLGVYPAALLDAAAYHGIYSDSSLFTLKIFNDIEMYHGALNQFDVSTFLAPEFEPNAYHGNTKEFTLETLPVFQVNTTETGIVGTVDLKDYPAIELDLNTYHGVYSDSTFQVSTLIECNISHGVYSDVDLEIFESFGFGDIDILTGEYSNVDLAYTPTLDVIGETGQLLTTELNVTSTFNADSYNGINGDLDLIVPPAPEFDPNANHGIYSIFDISETKALFVRAHMGANAESDFTISPAIDVELNCYTGESVILESLDETDFNTFAFNGSTLNDFNLQISVNLIPDENVHGLYAETDLAYTPTFECDMYDGHNGTVSAFEVPVGEVIVAQAYSGESFEPSLDAPFHAQFILNPIVASQTLYDGLGGVGGLNHCPLSSSDLDPIWGDNVTRLGFDPLGITDQLNVSFDDIGDDPWTTCNGGGMKFNIEFLTNPRFEMDAYAGESVEMFIPLKVFALIGADVPLSRLYDFEYQAIIVKHFIELDDIRYETTGTVWDNPEDVTAFYELYFSAELDLTAFGQFYQGVYANASLAVPVPAWKTAQKPIETGEHIRLEFEPIEYTRFCKGYIVPNGNSVVFDFDSSEDYDCSIFLGAFGERLNNITLNTIQSINTNEIPFGSVLNFNLEVQELWTLLAAVGAEFKIRLYDEPEFECESYMGSSVEIDFFEPPVDGYHGGNMAIDDLVIPGPGIAWVTETQCLPNEYIPITPDGDEDTTQLLPDENGVVQIPSVPVENKPYRAIVLAQCVTFIEPDEDS